MKRKILFFLMKRKNGPEFYSGNGERFLELEFLTREFLRDRVERYYSNSREVASQLGNVLRNCDEISYEEEGTAEAYALLHFLDRYHRFQITYSFLDEQGLMPIKEKGIDILDVGTGPGPSMYAVSDFYSKIYGWEDIRDQKSESNKIRIDYVERSSRFRDWLHHFTEFVNYASPSKRRWHVPFHHGTFSDFQDLEFNRSMSMWDVDEEGFNIRRKYVKKHRFDLIVFSNFLTTKEQVSNFKREIQDCARNLRNNGIFLVVGARGFSKKYKEVYDLIDEIVLNGSYSRRKFTARCEKVILENQILSYKWNDRYGERIKEALKEIYLKIYSRHGFLIDNDTDKVLRNTMEKSYDKSIEWEIKIYRKKAFPRKIISII